MKIVALADTHGHHRDLDCPDGDVLVHAGDFTHHGQNQDDFIDWFINQPYDHRVLTRGNHETMGRPQATIDQMERILHQHDDLHYVHYRPVTLQGVRFGPAGGDPDTDVVVTHQPPVSILDNGKGDRGLLQAVNQIDPDVHVFGHIHEGRGRIRAEGRINVNASIVDHSDQPAHDPFVITIDVG